jgi:hypothetical protein
LPGGIQYAAGRARALGRNLVAEQGGHRGQGQGVVFLLSLYLQQSRGSRYWPRAWPLCR